MRILLLHSRPLDFAKTTGGVPEFLKAITREYKQLGLDVSIYAGDKFEKNIHHTSTVHDTVKIFTGPLQEPAFWVSRKKIRLVADLCRQENIGVMHSQGTYTPGFMTREVARMTKIPYVITSHSDISPVNSKRLQRSGVRARCRRILQDAAWVTHLTPAMEQASHQILDTRSKSTLIHNGVDIDSWRPYQQLPEKNYILGLGRLEPGKGFHVLIEMYAQLLQRGVTTSLVIAGTGAAEADLRQQCERLGLNIVSALDDVQQIPERSVVFAGYVRDEMKYLLVAHSQCVLFATQPDLWEEAFGIVQLEAMAAGKPLIASDIAATRYLATLGMNVEMVAAKDISAWAQAVQSVLVDPLKRQAMGAANLAAVNQFAWRSVAEQYRDVYVRVMELRRR
jgi:glycosyltransferase involved in cell wall biosynthesis